MRARWLAVMVGLGAGCGGGAPGERGVPAMAMGGSASSAGGAASGGPASGAGGTATVSVAAPALRTVVYLPSYRGALSSWSARIDGSRMSYLNLCFAEVDAQGNVSYPDPGLDAFVASAHAAGVKVCLAIGGGSVIETGGPFEAVLQDEMRAAFVDQLAQYALAHQLDCIDVDLEGNAVNAHYEAFVTALAPKLHDAGKLMTSAVSSWFGDKISLAALQAFDFVNVMAYDLHDPAGSTQPVQSASIEEATQEVEYWIERGLPKEKAVFGVPFYGFRWTGGTGEALTYAQILAGNPAAETSDQVDLSGAVTYLNSRATIVAKARLAKQYGGIMIWELGQDAAGEASLLKAIADATR